MKFWGWVLFSFNGRISRMYYWLVALIFVVVEMIYLGVFFGSNMDALASGDLSAMSPISFICMFPLIIAAIWIGLAVAVKRWHDRAKSGWWILIGLVPIIGPIWVLIECGFLAGTDGVNQYGMSNVPPADPLSASSAPAASAPPPPPPAPPQPAAPPPAAPQAPVAPTSPPASAPPAAPDAGPSTAQGEEDTPSAPQP